MLRIMGADPECLNTNHPWQALKRTVLTTWAGGLLLDPSPQYPPPKLVDERLTSVVARAVIDQRWLRGVDKRCQHLPQNIVIAHTRICREFQNP